jgi:hypothetical protein
MLLQVQEGKMMSLREGMRVMAAEGALVREAQDQSSMLDVDQRLCSSCPGCYERASNGRHLYMGQLQLTPDALKKQCKLRQLQHTAALHSQYNAVTA